jgi:ribosomal protein S18 acetylase RimI-like enzyme
MRMLRMDHTHLDQVAPLPLPAGYALRPYEYEDWDACIELMLRCPDPAYTAGPWDRGLCERSMLFAADPSGTYGEGRGQLVFAGHELVAIALCSATGYLNQVYTLPAHRRRGLASAAVTRVLAVLAAQGLARCFLMVFEENEGAQRCYAHLGFVRSMPPLSIGAERGAEAES